MQCVNVVIGVHIVVLSVLLVVVRVVPIFLAVTLYSSHSFLVAIFHICFHCVLTAF